MRRGGGAERQRGQGQGEWLPVVNVTMCMHASLRRKHLPKYARTRKAHTVPNSPKLPNTPQLFNILLLPATGPGSNSAEFLVDIITEADRDGKVCVGGGAVNVEPIP